MLCYLILADGWLCVKLIFLEHNVRKSITWDILTLEAWLKRLKMNELKVGVPICSPKYNKGLGHNKNSQIPKCELHIHRTEGLGLKGQSHTSKVIHFPQQQHMVNFAFVTISIESLYFSQYSCQESSEKCVLFEQDLQYFITSLNITAKRNTCCT